MAAALNLFGSDLVVLSGGILQTSVIIIEAIKRTVKMCALEFISKRIRIEKTSLGENAASIGAAITFIDSIFSDSKRNIFDFEQVAQLK
ncbi:MAG: ROK family protein [Candidatus Humimicrobiaceae bacterium]